MSAKTSVMVVVVLLAVPVLAVAQSEWYDDPGYPVVPPPDPGAWDGHRYPAGVVKVDGIYHLYYIGQLSSSLEPDDFQNGHATSLDGVDWELDLANNPVLRRGAPGEWDDVGAALGAVIHDGVEFRLWYGGSDGQVGRVGYATSDNGSLWEKQFGTWILDVGPPGSFDDTFVLPGTVIFHDDLYRMWYFAGRTVSPGDYDWRVGYAWSDDGVFWTKHPEPVLGPRPGNDRMLVINLNVAFDGTGYHMWYTTDEDTPGTLNIAYAVSPDGVEWTRYPWNPVVGGNSGQPAVLRDQDSGEYTMWYADHPGLSFWRATSECCAGVFFDGFEYADTAAWSATVP